MLCSYLQFSVKRFGATLSRSVLSNMGQPSMLLAVHCKKTESVDLKGPVWNYIAATYSEQQANDATDDLATVQQLRSEIVGLTGSLPQLRETVCK